jgi:very-short-patch-repair endonuclease
MIQIPHALSRMNKAGLKVLRFSDMEVFKNLDGVIEVIWGNLP